MWQLVAQFLLMLFCVLMSIYVVFQNLTVTMVVRMSFFYITDILCLSGPVCLFVTR